ncbi:MAG: SPOR domain-containing protein [Spirochaetales bacterium]|nr:SPOR domain-containing protein [Spirochaetales bacterium]
MIHLRPAAVPCPALFLFVALASAGLASPALAEAPATDAKSRMAALEAAKGTARFSAAFEAALDEAADVDELVALVDRFGPGLADHAARFEAWERAAATLELAGRYDEAAERYGKAAAAIAGKTDAVALLASATCWLQAGECKRSMAMAELAALSSTDRDLDWRADLVLAWGSVCSGDASRARSFLSALTGRAGDPDRKAAVLLLSWALSEGEARSSLAAELAASFPGSPEALVAAGVNAPSPFWYLAFPRPATTGTGVGARVPAPAPSAGAGTSPTVATPEAPAATSPSGGSVEASGPRAYQIGLFSEKGNADRLASDLRKRGFEVALESRERPGSAPALAVLVPVRAGTDPAALLLKLKDAGFEAWPIF